MKYFRLTIKLTSLGVSFSCEIPAYRAEAFAKSAGMPWPARASDLDQGEMELSLEEI